MITLYRPVLIESAEQAEALPVGTVALDHPTGNADRLPYVKATATRWASVWGVDDLGAIDAYGTAPNDAMVGDRALVRIEADEEVLTQDTYASSEQLRRFTTPWQRFTSPKETP